MSDSGQLHRQQPTRLPRPWDSPGKNSEVGCHFLLQCMKVNSQSEVAKSCLTFSDPMDCSPPGSSIHGIFQARVLEWGAIAFSNACKWKVKVKPLSCVRLLVTPRTAAYQAPPSMGFSIAPYISGLQVLSDHFVSFLATSLGWLTNSQSLLNPSWGHGKLSNSQVSQGCILSIFNQLFNKYKYFLCNKHSSEHWHQYSLP